MSANAQSCSAALIDENIRIAADGFELQARLTYGESGRPAYSALIAGPHPLLGGDFDNNMVRALANGVASDGGVALTFNYGGVAASGGGPSNWADVTSNFWEASRFDEEHLWVRDTATALAALCDLVAAPLTVIGYSFGCWALAEILVAGRARAAAFVSPAPSRHSFASMRHARIPLVVVHSANDFACSAEEVEQWCAGLRTRAVLELLPSSEHFFRGQEHSVVDLVIPFLRMHGTGVRS